MSERTLASSIASVRPKKTKMERHPLGFAIRQLLVTLAGDGRVEWCGQKPDCSGLGSEWEVGSRKTNMSSYEEV